MSALPSREMKFIQTPDGQKPVWNNSSLHQLQSTHLLLKERSIRQNPDADFTLQTTNF